MAAPAVGDGGVGTRVHALETHDASRGVDDVVIEVDALRGAHIDAAPTVDTEVGVDVGVVERDAGYVAEYGAHRADCVADQTSVASRDGDDHGESGSGCKKPAYPYDKRAG